jgi:hypothetical protein
MNYTPEQRAIIARMGNASRRIREARARHRNAQNLTTSGINDSIVSMTNAVSALAQAVVALSVATEQSNELEPLFEEHANAFHEFLDSL